MSPSTDRASSSAAKWLKWSVGLNILLIAVVAFVEFRQGTSYRLRETRTRRSEGETNRAAAPAQVPSAVAANAPAGSRISWRADNLQQVVDGLRSSGAPRNVVAAVLEALTREQFVRRRMEVLHPGGFKRWVPPEALQTPEMFSRLEQIKREHQDELRKVMGADYDQAMFDDSPERRLMWGDLSQEKIAKLQRLTDDYTTMRRSSGYGGNLHADGLRLEARLDAEYERDVRAALSPAEADDFLVFNSPFAKGIQERLKRAGIDVDETQYRSLYATALKARAGFLNDAGPSASGATGDAYLAAEAAAFRQVLDDESVLRLVVARHEPFRGYEALLRAAGVSAEQRLNLFSEFTAGFAEIFRNNTLRKTDPTAAAAKDAADAARLYEQLVARLPEGSRKQFDATSTGKLLLRMRGKPGG